jgi:hypothetical protein
MNAIIMKPTATIIQVLEMEVAKLSNESHYVKPIPAITSSYYQLLISIYFIFLVH